MSGIHLPDLNQRSMSKEAIELFQGPIGQLMLNFAFVDQALDFWLMEIFPHAVKSNIAAKMPFDLGHKIVLLRKCFDRLPKLAREKQQAFKFLDVVERHNKVRNTIAHGAVSHFEKTPSPTMFFARLRYDKAAGVHLMQDEAVSLADLSRVNNETADTVAEMHMVAKRLLRFNQ